MHAPKWTLPSQVMLAGLVGSLPMTHGLYNMFLQYMHEKGSVLLHIYHCLIWVQVANYNVYSNLSLHEVLHVDHKTTIIEILLKHMNF